MLKSVINNYAKENSKRLRAEYAVTANYFQEMNNEYTVKCGVYDSDGGDFAYGNKHKRRYKRSGKNYLS